MDIYSQYNTHTYFKAHALQTNIETTIAVGPQSFSARHFFSLAITLIDT